MSGGDSRFALLNQNFLNHHLYQWHSNQLSSSFWVPGPYIKIFFLNIFIWTFPRIAFKFNMPQTVFLSLLSIPRCSVGQTVAIFLPVTVRSWMSFLPLSHIHQTFNDSTVLSSFFQLPKHLLSVSTSTIFSDMIAETFWLIFLLLFLPLSRPFFIWLPENFSKFKYDPVSSLLSISQWFLMAS